MGQCIFSVRSRAALACRDLPEARETKVSHFALPGTLPCNSWLECLYQNKESHGEEGVVGTPPLRTEDLTLGCGQEPFSG